MDPEQAFHASYINRSALKDEAEAGCYFCLRNVLVSTITEWIDDGDTACCPNCSVDALIPGRQSEADLSAAHVHWFTGAAPDIDGNPV